MFVNKNYIIIFVYTNRGDGLSFDVSPSVRLKLSEKHDVNLEEVQECFSNREGGFIEDSREEHKTNPATQWFIAETDRLRLLKVVFVQFPDGSIHLKTSYEPNEVEKNIYIANYGPLLSF